MGVHSLGAHPIPGGGDIVLIGACVAGVMTAHMLMPEVLANRPERLCPECDGYIATVECKHIGTRYTLLMAGKRFRVMVADCATSKPVGQWPLKLGRPWLGDVAPLAGVGILTKPTPALLCADGL